MSSECGWSDFEEQRDRVESEPTELVPIRTNHRDIGPIEEQDARFLLTGTPTEWRDFVRRLHVSGLDAWIIGDICELSPWAVQKLLEANACG